VVRSLVVVDACSVDKEVVDVTLDVRTVVGIFSVVAAADVDGWIVSGRTVETSAVDGCSGMLVDVPALVPASTVVDAAVIGSEVVGTIVGVAKVVTLVLSAGVEGSSAACVGPSVGAKVAPVVTRSDVRTVVGTCSVVIATVVCSVVVTGGMVETSAVDTSREMVVGGSVLVLGSTVAAGVERSSVPCVGSSVGAKVASVLTVSVEG
jgi:hypothetical protein